MDTIDSRDVIARIDDLTNEKQSSELAVEDALDALKKAEAALLACDDPEDSGERQRLAEEVEECEEVKEEADDKLKDWIEEGNQGELEMLEELQGEAEGYASDWHHGVTLVRDSYWTQYCQELLDDCGDVPKDLPSYIVIDWGRTADNLQADYTSVDFAGVTYWVR